MSATIAKITLERNPRTPSSEQVQMLEADLARQALTLSQFVSQMRVYSAEISGGQPFQRQQVEVLLESLLHEYLGEHWRDYDLVCELGDLLQSVEPGEESLDEQTLTDELRGIFWVLDLPIGDGAGAWSKIRSYVDTLIQWESDDMMEVLPGTLVYALALFDEPDSLRLSDRAQGLLRLAALPQKVRALFGIYRDDELAVSGSRGNGTSLMPGPGWVW